MRPRKWIVLVVVAAVAVSAWFVTRHRGLVHRVKAFVQRHIEPQVGPSVASGAEVELPPIAREFRPALEIFRQGLVNEWEDWGWTDRELKGPGPAKLVFANYGGWILHHRPLTAPYGALAFRLKAPKEFGDFLEVVVLEEDGGTPDPVIVRDRHRFSEPDGWVQVIVPMYELNPFGTQFSGVRLRAARQVGTTAVLVDQIVLTEPLANAPAPRSYPSRDATVKILCSAPTHRISPLIFGLADRRAPKDLNAAAYRLGGNPMSRFNWKLGNAWNTGEDWYFRNVQLGWHWRDFLNEVHERGAEATLVVPLVGWVAKDTTSYSFSVAALGPQKDVEPDNPDRGNGVGSNGKNLKPPSPTTTSVEAPPEFVREWVATISAENTKRSRQMHSYILDNEPALWNSTHRDVHPEALGYDELLDRTIRYGAAVRAADPKAIIAGPAEWGWSNYFWSAVDALTNYSSNPDRKAHGDVPLLDWYLSKLREHEQKTGVRILDIVDLHFYPQGKGIVRNGGGGLTDADTVRRRLRATRALWDEDYTDESWIKEKIRLIPRLKEIIARNYPGLGISIGEWNFGAEGHISGGLAVAEVLGRYAEGGITSAYYWTSPKPGSPAYWGFRAFRNYDGKNSGFLENFVKTTAVSDVSVFASRDEARQKMVFIVVQMRKQEAVKLRFDLADCGPVAEWRSYVYSGGPKGFVPAQSGSSADVLDTLAPFSIAVFEVQASSGRQEPPKSTNQQER